MISNVLLGPPPPQTASPPSPSRCFLRGLLWYLVLLCPCPDDLDSCSYLSCPDFCPSSCPCPGLCFCPASSLFPARFHPSNHRDHCGLAQVLIISTFNLQFLLKIYIYLFYFFHTALTWAFYWLVSNAWNCKIQIWCILLFHIVWTKQHKLRRKESRLLC